MEGPTPVSALIHAATMVTAGVYLVARSSDIYVLAPNAMLLVAVIGGVTAIFAASIGLVQYDIKKVLAYSTVSQLGYMFLACGVGAFWVGIFHLYTHAFFKGLLFLGSGSVIHAVGGEQDMRKMGALKDKIPITYKTMLVGALAIAGIPGLAGFFSKDEILWKTFSSHHTLLYALGLLTAMMTAFYMFRLIYMTFHGDDRVAPETHVHESPRSMTVPLIVLAAGSVLAGWIGTPIVFGPIHDALPSLEHWLGTSVVLAGAHGEGAEHPSALIEWGLMALSVGLVLAAIWLATRMFRTAEYQGEPMHRLVGRTFHKVLLNKYNVDEIYGALFVRGAAKGGGSQLAEFDRQVVDGAVNSVGALTRLSSSLTMFFDKWVVDGIVNVVGFGVKFISYPVRMFQTGLVQNYALLFLIGVGVVAGYYLFS
jgi:NADH-quinone oxidoreductase subunit L